MMESGIADFILTFWSGVVARPARRRRSSSGSMRRSIRACGRRDRADPRGRRCADDAGSPQDFGNFIASETVKWSAVAKTAGLAQE